MEIQKQEIRQLCSKFMLTGMGANLEDTVNDAEKNGIGFMQFTLQLLKSEVEHRQRKDEVKRMKSAGLPRSSDLAIYDAEKKWAKNRKTLAAEGAQLDGSVIQYGINGSLRNR
ncbi:hypothetical protein ACFSOV_07420 [Pedobacter petrophilus]|uniref:hypothetical protein n=1 Tax=Pedobacter petrophilus TaxID=1908241 RepID=UPI001FD80848|nr:hypothetical protein [Pedobacter petrophilus]